MKFAVYKLNFAAGVHLGTGTLASGANTLPADTLFSALCMEAAQLGEKSIKTLVDAVRQNRLRIGDLFPFICKNWVLLRCGQWRRHAPRKSWRLAKRCRTA